MPIDASIYNRKPVNMLEGLESGMRIKDMFTARKRQAKQDEQNEQLFKKKMEEADFDKQYKENEVIGRLLGGVKDQATYDSARNEATRLGISGVDRIPTIYDPNVVRSLQYRALTTKEQLDDQIKQRELGIREQEARTKAKESGSKAGFSEGQKALDKDFAKDYNEWTSGGSSSARSEIDKLRGVLGRLETGEVTTGGLTGAFPDRFTSDKVLKARADVESTVMNSLKAILGAQFTEKEGNRIIKATWNEADSTQNNLDRLSRLVTDLEDRANAKDAKSQYYANKGGTLSGFGTNSPSPQTQQKNLLGGMSRPPKLTPTQLNNLNDQELDKLVKAYGG